MSTKNYCRRQEMCIRDRVMDSKPIELSTYSGYEQQLNNPIAPYFREHPVALCDLTKQDILAFYAVSYTHLDVYKRQVGRPSLRQVRAVCKELAAHGG